VGDVLRDGKASGQRPLFDTDPATWFLEQELYRIREDSRRGVILDFSPVTSDGAKQLTAMLHRQGFDICHVVYVKTTMRDAEVRYVSRGRRPGDASESPELLFRRRIAQEFWSFTLPMVRSAVLQGNLLILKNHADEAALRLEVIRVAGAIAATGRGF
jgi:hypothetical protein